MTQVRAVIIGAEKSGGFVIWKQTEGGVVLKCSFSN